MLMIVRVTSKCNFKCDFCSASMLQGNSLSVDAILSAVRKYNPSAITFEGGDPLVMPPQFYERLFRELLQYNPSIELAMTTNLWNWYKNPEKWGVLNDYDVQVCTSFQYGNKRKITDSRPYTEDIFLDVVEKWKALMRKRLSFISVIDYDNADSVMKTVKLAKRLKMFCKLNACFVSGRAKESYPWDLMLGHYADIVESGLAYWEDNSYQIAQLMLRSTNALTCPILPDCERCFIVLNPDGSVKNCSTAVDSNGGDSNVVRFYPKTPIVTPECLTCEWFRYCNSCRVYRDSIATYHSPEYCQRVDDALSRIKAWAESHQDYFE